VQEGQLLMTQAERDRLVALKKAKKKLITQKQAAEELGITERHVRRLLRELQRRGDKAVVHALRGLPSNRGVDVETQREAVAILTRPVYRGFGPTLASEYLAKKHKIDVSRETVRQWMIEAKLWRARKQHVEKMHEWRPRRSRFGELVQWDTSDHDWLEGRGDQMLLINMIDDATSRWFARFVPSDSTVENMNLLERYLKKHGRPLAFYTDKASLFQTAEKTKRGESAAAKDRAKLPPTQIGRALQELGITWIAAHSPQAKGRVERGFSTAQDRLVKGLRVAGVSTMEQANHYLETEFLPWCNELRLRELRNSPQYMHLSKQDVSSNTR
jgi:DNA-binding Lrp family transcriptional regulator